MFAGQARTRTGRRVVVAFALQTERVAVCGETLRSLRSRSRQRQRIANSVCRRRTIAASSSEALQDGLAVFDELGVEVIAVRATQTAFAFVHGSVLQQIVRTRTLGAAESTTVRSKHATSPRLTSDMYDAYDGERDL